MKCADDVEIFKVSAFVMRQNNESGWGRGEEIFVATQGGMEGAMKLAAEAFVCVGDEDLNVKIRFSRIEKIGVLAAADFSGVNP